MANYDKGGEIFIDLGGINVEITSTTNTKTFTVDEIYSRLETAFNLGKRIVITNYKSKYGNNLICPCKISPQYIEAVTIEFCKYQHCGNCGKYHK